MSRSLIAALAAALLLSSSAEGAEPVRHHVLAAAVGGCWSGVTWDEAGIPDLLAIEAN